MGTRRRVCSGAGGRVFGVAGVLYGSVPKVWIAKTKGTTGVMDAQTVEEVAIAAQDSVGLGTSKAARIAVEGVWW